MTLDGESTVEVRTSASAALIPTIRAVASDLAARADFDLDAIADLRMAVDEACATLVDIAAPSATLRCTFLVHHERIEVHAEVENAEPLAVRSFGCEMCGAGELLARVQSEVALVLATVTWPEPVTEPAAATTPNAQPEAASPVRGRVRLRPLGMAGTGVVSTGAVAVIVGAVLWSRDDRLELRPDDLEGPVWKRSWRPPGIGLVAGGIGALAVGGALITVDLVRGRRRAVTVRPVIERGLAALVVGGRF